MDASFGSLLGLDDAQETDDEGYSLFVNYDEDDDDEDDASTDKKDPPIW